MKPKKDKTRTTSKPYRSRKDKIITENTCEWCETTYPSFDKTVRYYKVIVFRKEHKICSECKKELKLIK